MRIDRPAIIALPCLVYAMDLIVLNLAVPTSLRVIARL
jgi:hypothetical protein